MGKKRVIKKTGLSVNKGLRERSIAKGAKKKVDRGVLHVEATYNNTKLTLTDMAGNALAWSSSGALGFTGSKKGTPFAAAKVGDLIAERAQMIGMTEADVIMRGVGSGRESSVRAFIARGIGLGNLKDVTPIPFNGPQAKKPRRV